MKLIECTLSEVDSMKELISVYNLLIERLMRSLVIDLVHSIIVLV